MSNPQSGWDEQTERIMENLQGVDWTKIGFNEFDDLFEDRDPFEFL